MSSPRTLADLVVTRLTGASTFFVTRDVVVARPTKGYVVVYAGAGALMGSRLVGTTSRLRWGFRAVCVGFTIDQSLLVVGAVRALIVGWRPEPSNPSAGWLVEVPDDPPTLRDDSVPDDIRYSTTLYYRLTTNRS